MSIHRPIYMTAAIVMTVLLAVMVLSAQGNLDTVRQAAEQDYADAQLNLGVMYSNGRGVLKDSVRAHMWFNIAGANGDEAARKQRDNLEDDMTSAEISRATELARTCMASDYKDCQP